MRKILLFALVAGLCLQSCVRSEVVDSTLQTGLESAATTRSQEIAQIILLAPANYDDYQSPLMDLFRDFFPQEGLICVNDDGIAFSIMYLEEPIDPSFWEVIPTLPAIVTLDSGEELIDVIDDNMFTEFWENMQEEIDRIIRKIKDGILPDPPRPRW